MSSKTTGRLADTLCAAWVWVMGIFAIDDGEELYDDDEIWADWETEVL